MNDTIATIEKRRSIRLFEDREVGKDVIDELKRLTLRAPSAGNQEFYSVIEVTDPEKKKVLAKCCDNQPMIEKAPVVWVFLADVEKWYTFFKASKSDEKSGKALRKPSIGDFHLAMQDAVIAAQNAVIAAEALGLGSCYIGDVIENYETVKELLDLPKWAAPACMLIMGYPKGIIKAPLSKRPEADGIFMENRYRKMDFDELERVYHEQEEALRKNGALPYENTGSIADRYYKKYASDFMAEMNRSAAVFLKRWCDGIE